MRGGGRIRGRGQSQTGRFFRVERWVTFSSFLAIFVTTHSELIFLRSVVVMAAELHREFFLLNPCFHRPRRGRRGSGISARMLCGSEVRLSFAARWDLKC